VTVPISRDAAELNRINSKQSVVFAATVPVPSEHASDLRDGGIMVALERKGRVVSDYEPVLLFPRDAAAASRPATQATEE
jgi:hypothetical protein